MSTPSTRHVGSDGAVRVVRAVLLAAVTVAFSAGAHTLAGGGLPSATGVALLGSLTLVVTGVLGRRELTPWTLVPTLIVLQSALHLGFQALAAPPGGAGVAPSGTAPAGTDSTGHHGHHGLHDLVGTLDPVLGAASPLPIHTHSHPAMLLAHLGAVAAITLLAVGADRALGRTVGRVVRLFRAPDRPAPVDDRSSVVRAGAETAPRSTLWMIEARPHRGPPPVLGAV